MMRRLALKYLRSRVSDYIDISLVGVAIGYTVSAIHQRPEPDDTLYLTVGFGLLGALLLSIIPAIIVILGNLRDD